MSNDDNDGGETYSLKLWKDKEFNVGLNTDDASKDKYG